MPVARTYSPWQRPLAAGTWDVVIVGGGIMGCATAYWLRRFEPSLRVALCEAETLAFGASGRNAGFLLLGTHTDYASAVEAFGRARARLLWQFTAENVRLIREELDGAAFNLQMTGSMIAAGSTGEAARLQHAAKLLAEDGADAEYLEADTANARMHSEGFQGALAVPEGGTLHPGRLVRYLAAQSGASVLEGWPVTALEADGEAVRLTSPSGDLRARRVVLTLNAYLPRLLPDAAAYVRPVRAQMLATEPLAPFLDVPVYSHEGFFYLRQLPDGRMYLGGARHLHEAEEVGFGDVTTVGLQADLEAYLRIHFPQVGAPTVERRWSGTMGFSPDGLPVVGAVPDLPAATFATGFTGHGMGFSVRFGQLLAHRVLGRKDRHANLFDVARLHDTSWLP